MIDERLRACYAAFSRGDFDEAVSPCHPRVERHRPGGLAPLVGADLLRAWMKPDAFAENDTWDAAREAAGLPGA